MLKPITGHFRKLGLCTVLISIVFNDIVLNAAEPPADQNYVGINGWFLSDWDGSNAFIDIMVHARDWNKATWGSQARLDENGWPMEDCSNVIFGEHNKPGTYKLIFTGKATVISLLWNTGTVTNVTFDAVRNETRADVNLPNKPVTGGLIFTGTQRTADSPVGSGITGVHLYRPGYPVDGSRILTDEYLAILKKFHVFRYMDWIYTNNNPVSKWSQRRTPLQADVGEITIDGHKGVKGLPVEYFIQTSNEANADMWINIPVFADSDYVKKTIQTILYGSDGTNPYISAQTNPVFPPLKPELKVYIEYGNEIWNFAGGFWCFQWVHEMSNIARTVLNHPIRFGGENDEWVCMWRFVAWKLAEISKITRAVVGDNAMMSRFRPVLESQLGYPILLAGALPFTEQFYGTVHSQNPVAHPVNYFFYGAGGSGYYGVYKWDYESFFDAVNYPESTFVRSVRDDAMWAKNYGLKRVAYEGGMGLDVGTASLTDMQKKSINASPSMKDMVVKYHNAWSAAGGDLLVYYSATGQVNWTFTDNPGDTNSAKLQGIAALNGQKREPLGFGMSSSGESYLLDNKFLMIGYGYIVDVEGRRTQCGIGPNSSVLCPVNATADGIYSISFKIYTSDLSTDFDIYVNGDSVGRAKIVTTKNEIVVTTPVNVALSKGLNLVRLHNPTKRLGLQSLIINPANVNVEKFVNHNASNIQFRNLQVSDAEGRTLNTIQIPSEKKIRVALYTIAGRCVFNQLLEPAEKMVVIPMLSNGNYVVNAMVDNRVMSSKTVNICR
jgi:hypothetical protein